MPVFQVTVRRHRTETRLVVEECEVTIEVGSAEEVQAALSEAQEEGILDSAVEWWTISTSNEENDEPAVVEVQSCEEAEPGTEPDIFMEPQAPAGTEPE